MVAAPVEVPVEAARTGSDTVILSGAVALCGSSPTRRYADDIVALCEGRLVAHGPPAEIITSELVRDLYGVEAVVVTDPVTGIPLVVPVRLAPAAPIPDRRTARPLSPAPQT